MKTQAEITAALAQCYGSENNYFNDTTLAAKMTYTDGVKTLADMADAHWLIDAIASHQPACRRDDMCKHMQFWTLTVFDTFGILTCDRDAGDQLIQQEILFTDFPLHEIKIWLEAGHVRIKGVVEQVMVAMLPSER